MKRFKTLAVLPQTLVGSGLAISIAALIFFTLSFNKHLFSSEQGLSVNYSIKCYNAQVKRVDCSFKLQKVALGRAFFRVSQNEKQEVPIEQIHLRVTGNLSNAKRVVLKTTHNDFKLEILDSSNFPFYSEDYSLNHSFEPRPFSFDLTKAKKNGPLTFVFKEIRDSIFTVEDFGVYESQYGEPLFHNVIRHTYHPPHKVVKRYYYSLYFCFLFVLAAVLLKRNKRESKIYSFAFSTLVMFFALSYVAMDLYVGTFPAAPYEFRDLVTHWSIVALEAGGSNLNYGQHMAKSFFEGDGLLPYWHRMPGYGVFSVLSGLFTGADIFSLTKANTLFQMLFFGLSVTVFFSALRGVVSTWVRLIIVFLIVHHPSRFVYTQIESVMPGLLLLNLSSIFYFFKKTDALKDFSNPFHHFVLHSGFALWFFFRPDVLPAWLVFSGFLYFKPKRMKWFTIPVFLFLVIGGTWGYQRVRFGNDFTLTTHSVGCSLLVGVLELRGPHKWTAEDATCFDLSSTMGLHATTQQGSRMLQREALKYILKYPLNFFAVVYSKFHSYISDYAFSGVTYRPLQNVPQILPRNLFLYFKNGIIVFFFFICGLGILWGPRKHLNLMVFWPTLLNLPLFFIFYSGMGRFAYPGTMTSTILATILLTDPKFYKSILRNKAWFLLLLVIPFTIYFNSGYIKDFLINSKERWTSGFYHGSSLIYNHSE